ncbi:MAG: CpaF family protein [Anaerolineales bacterium]|nr:CpaF family protein [Anaerolineales bacterium]
MLKDETFGLREIDRKVLPEVQENLAYRKIRPPDWRDDSPESRQKFFDAVRGILISAVPQAELNDIATRLCDALTGVGILQPFLRLEGVEEIYVRGDKVAVERNGRLEHLGALAPASYFEQMIRRVADATGKPLSPLNLTLLVDLPGGERFTALLPPLSDSPVVNIRCFGRNMRGLEDLERVGTFKRHLPLVSGSLEDIRDADLRRKVKEQTSPMARYLAWVMATLAGSVVFAGPFSSGKTTIFNALSDYFPVGDPVAVLETFREIKMRPEAFSMRAIAPAELLPGDTRRITMDEVLNIVYTRANPRAIILGEVVSPGEALQFLRAANLGRKAFTTLHGGSVGAALRRLEDLALSAQEGLNMRAVREMVVSGIDLVVLMSQAANPKDPRAIDRFVAEITHLEDIDENGNYVLRTLYRGVEGADESLFGKAWKQIAGENLESES